MPEKLSRRDFLRITALAAAGAATGCASPTATPEPPTPTVEGTPVPVLSVKERLEAIGWLPGAPDHERGWETYLPLVDTAPDAEEVTITGSKRVEQEDMLLSEETDTSPYWQVSMELFNINWQLAWTAVADDLPTKYNLGQAAGDLPDWMEEIPLATYVNFIEADTLEDFTETFESTANPEWVKGPLDNYLSGEEAWSYCKVNGRIMGFPVAERAANNAKLLFARQDWLDAVGMDMPETLDDVAEVGLAFKNADLGAGEETYGLNLSKSIGRGPSWGGGGWFASADGITGAFGAMSACWLEDGNGGLQLSDITPEMKEAMALLADWYARGVIPADFFTVEDWPAQGRSGANLAGLHYAPAWGTRWPIEDSLTNDPDALWTWGRIPAGPDGKRGSIGEMPYWVINGFNAGFEHVGRAIECFNWWVQLTENPDNDFYGWEGYLVTDSEIGFEWTDDNKLQAPTDPPAGVPGFGPRWMRGGTYMDTYAMANNFAKVESWVDVPEAERNALQEYLLQDPLGTISEYRKAYVFVTDHEAEDCIFNKYLGLPTPGMQAYDNSLNQLRDETFYGIIKGDKSIDAFDDFVDDWLAQGGEQITQEVNDWYSSR
jgi:putative aldouronate transport system substrate-binding protein